MRNRGGSGRGVPVNVGGRGGGSNVMGRGGGGGGAMMARDPEMLAMMARGPGMVARDPEFLDFLQGKYKW